MSGPALLLFGIAVTGSTVSGSLVFAALTIAAGVGGPLFGVALDRVGYPGRLLAAALLSYGLGLATVALLLGHAPTGVAVGVAVLVGLLAPALAGGWTSQLSVVLPPERLTRGHAMDAATYNVASLAGPTLAAGIASSWGARWAVAGAVTILLVAVPLAWRLPTRKVHDVITYTLRAGLAADLRAGLQALGQIPGPRRTSIASCVAYLGFGMFIVACPSLGRTQFGNDGRGALLLSLMAATALTATVAMSQWPPTWTPQTTFIAATSLAVIGLLLAAFARSPVVLIVGVAFLGLADGPQLAAIFALRQRDAPAHLRGQVFTTAASLKLTAGAIGAAAGGAVVTRSTTLDLVLAATTQAVALSYFARATRIQRLHYGRRSESL